MKKKGKETADRERDNESPAAVPEREKAGRLKALLYLCGSLVVLGTGIYVLATGKTLLNEGAFPMLPARWGEFMVLFIISLWVFTLALGEYDAELKNRIARFLAAPFFAGFALYILASAVYGIATGGLRLLFLGKNPPGGSIYLGGVSMWVLFLAYLSCSVACISAAAQYWIKNENLLGKIEKAWNKALILMFLLYLAALFLATRLHEYQSL